MSRRSMPGPWLHGAGRAVLVAGAAAGLVLGAGRLGAAPTQPQSPDALPKVATSLTTSYCPGDPFAAGDKGTPRADVRGSVDAHAAPPKVLEGVVTPSDEPGAITIEDVGATPAAPVDEKPRSGPMKESVDRLDQHPQHVRGSADRAPGLLATQSFLASGKQVRGLAATPCLAPTADAWLVAGGGAEGRQERLVLTNPGGNPVTARLDLVGTANVDSADRSVVVPARGRSVVLLDAIGGTGRAQAVHVTTTGGLVVPTIVEHHLDGLTTAGVETISPTMAPAKRLVLPGSADASARGIVLAAPGSRDAVVQIRRLGEGAARGVEVITVPADTVVDVDLPDVSGVRGWVVESDEPVVASAHLTTTDAGGRSDMAWSVATPSFGSLGGVALPSTPASGVRRFVDVTATGGPASVDVLLLEDGAIRTERLDIEQDRGVRVDAKGASAVWVRPSTGRVHAAAMIVGRPGGTRAEATSLPILPARVAVRDQPVNLVR
ncbi:hypothetical protein ASG73_08485 [Janibacter sp. Soil728]|uniref:DUF5719 family protein n=1 Tax=Janibacter sp. Soil728 TaxID=1736393 RepID=UPI000701B516|nr:DUF5719 family protein [Janibacter sp. Soil728]KRE37678.1 hypothetical protein ASG73_08485 [Janibacter sp. Soil728]